MKNFLFSVLHVIAGYLVFSVPSSLLFFLFPEKFRSLPGISFLVLSTLYGAFFSIAAGFVTSLLSKRRWFGSALALAILVAIPAALSIISNFGKPIIWSAIVSLCLFSPLVFVGGFVRAKIANK